MALLGGLFDWMFGWLINLAGHTWSLVIISFLITLLITLAYKVFTNQELMRSLKKELKDLQKEMKTLKDHPEKMTKINKQLMEKNLQYMKNSMRPMLFTFLPILVIFWWLRETFLPAGELFSWGFKIPLFGTGAGWLLTYIISSIIFSMILRKLLKVS